ncbi:MAG: VWA domain-containing protein [Dehalococcoidales bacterium]|nr:MAG: VWA domain-containing protein [Dehalococcoidales bacterium]
MRKKLTLRILLRYAVTFVFVLGIFTGIRFFMYNYHSEENIDMMMSQMSEQSGIGAELTSDYLRDAMGLDKPLLEKLWPFGSDSSWEGSSSVTPSPPPSSSMYSSSSRYDNNIGFSTGGAKNIVNFRENIDNGYLPLPTDVTCEGLFYDYYFDTGMSQPCDEFFCPSYSTAVTRDPISHQTEYYLSVGLNSGLKESDFQRKPLNLVIVLDISSSMTENFDQYYYDRDRDSYEDEGIFRKTKIDCAKDAVVTILRQLDKDDRYAIVLFNGDATLGCSWERGKDRNIERIEDDVWDIRATGSTNLDAGMKMASDLFRINALYDRREYENRIIVFTDAQTNTGDTSSTGLYSDVERNAEKRIYTTFIGIGVDFNTQLIELISKTKGANYYAVHSPGEFRKKMEEEFEFMVTPLVFDLELRFESRGWRIERVFGNPGADTDSGRLMTINTLFPSKSKDGNTKGGIVLLKLRRLTSEDDDKIYLRVDYEDRNGRDGSSRSVIRLDDVEPEHFDNTGIQKGVLLSRYAALLQNWMLDERTYLRDKGGWKPRIDGDTGISCDLDYSRNWERQSVRLKVSEPYSWLFKKFSRYFEDEMNDIGDYTLEQELDILDEIGEYDW